MKILVTGSTGFVGSNLVRFLKKNDFTVIETSREQLKTISPSSYSGVNTIVHLAGKAHDLKSACKPEEYYQVNFEITKRLYDAFLESDSEKFIFVSSVKAAADSFEGVLTESNTPAPRTDYGKSKLKAEQYIESKSLPENKSYLILRPCMIHGPGNKGNLNLLHNFVKKGIPYPLGCYNNKRSFLSIENLCFIIKELIKKENLISGVYQVSDDDPVSTREVVDILATSLGKKSKILNVPRPLIISFAKIGDFLGLPFNSERLSKLTENYIVSNNKLKQEIGRTLPISTLRGLEITAASFNRAITD